MKLVSAYRQSSVQAMTHVFSTYRLDGNEDRVWSLLVHTDRNQNRLWRTCLAHTDRNENRLRRVYVVHTYENENKVRPVSSVHTHRKREQTWFQYIRTAMTTEYDAWVQCRQTETRTEYNVSLVHTDRKREHARGEYIQTEMRARYDCVSLLQTDGSETRARRLSLVHRDGNENRVRGIRIWLVCSVQKTRNVS